MNTCLGKKVAVCNTYVQWRLNSEARYEKQRKYLWYTGTETLTQALNFLFAVDMQSTYKLKECLWAIDFGCAIYLHLLSLTDNIFDQSGSQCHLPTLALSYTSSE